MLSSLAPGSPAAVAILVGCFILVLFFEFSNDFHDTANAVATVIYTRSLRSGAGVQPRTVWMIAAAWVLTLPATIILSCGLFYLLS